MLDHLNKLHTYEEELKLKVHHTNKKHHMTKLKKCAIVITIMYVILYFIYNSIKHYVSTDGNDYSNVNLVLNLILLFLVIINIDIYLKNFYQFFLK